MNINVTARHMTLTPAMHEYAVHKITRALEGISRVDHVHVILSVEKHRQQAEAVLRVMHHTVEARDEQADLYAAMDGMTDKLVRQLETLRDKLTAHKGPGRAGDMG
jgi:putative sigma-54 modulation protein